MKKLLVLAGLLVALSPGLANAQELTKAEVEALSPQLMNVFTTMGATLPPFIRAKLNTQNSLLNVYPNVLRNLSLRLDSSPQPSGVELEEMAKTVAAIEMQVSSIADWRTRMKVATSNIIQILGNIGGMLASAA